MRSIAASASSGRNEKHWFLSAFAATKPILIAAVAFGGIAAGSSAAFAGTTYQTNTPLQVSGGVGAAGTNFNQATQWVGGVAPGAGDTGEVVANSLVRSTGGNNNVTFGAAASDNPGNPGTADSLILDGNGTPVVTADGQLKLRYNSGSNQPATVNINHLILNGGLLDVGDNAIYNLPGEVTVQATSCISVGPTSNNTLNPAANSGLKWNVTFSGQLDGSATIRLVNSSPYSTGTNNLVNAASCAPNFIINNANNPYNGTWEVDTGFLLGKAQNSLGANGVNFVLTGKLINDGNGGSGTSTYAPAMMETDYDLNDTAGSMTINASTNTGDGVHAGYLNFVLRLDQTWTFGALTLNGNVVANGTYSAQDLINLGIGFSAQNFAAGLSGTANSGFIVVGPEPTSLGFLGLGVIGALRRRGRRLGV